MIVEKDKMPTLKMVTYEEITSKKVFIPVLQREVEGTPETSLWLGNEIIECANGDNVKNIYIDSERVILYNREDGSIAVYDGQQRIIYIICFIKAYNKVLEERRTINATPIRYPDISFERKDMGMAYAAFMDGNKSHLNAKEKKLCGKMESMFNQYRNMLISECGSKKGTKCGKMMRNIEPVINGITFDAKIQVSEEYAIGSFIYANSGGIQMNKTNFCDAIVYCASQKFGVVYNADLFRDFVADAVITIYKKLGQGELDNTRLPALRTILDKYITKDKESFEDFVGFLVKLYSAREQNSYEFMNIVNRNDFTQLYMLAIANDRPINNEFFRNVITKLGYISLAASISGVRGSYFTSFLKKLETSLNNNAKTSTICKEIGEGLRKLAPLRFSENELRNRLIYANNKIHNLILCLIGIEYDKEKVPFEIRETDVEHFISKSGRRAIATYGVDFDNSLKESLGNKMELPISMNRSIKDMNLKQKVRVYSELGRAYNYDANVIKDVGETKAEIEGYIIDRGKKLADIIIHNDFFNEWYVDSQQSE